MAYINKKFLSLMLIMMSVLGMVSCLGDEKLSGIEDGDEDRPQTRLELAFAVGGTRFSGQDVETTGIEDAGEDFEYEINCARLYFFNANAERTLAYVRDYYWNKHPQPDEDLVVRYRTQDNISDFKDGDYEVLAVANFVNSNLPAVVNKMSDLINYVDNKSYPDGEVTGFYEGILMSTRVSDRVKFTKNNQTAGDHTVKIEIPLERCVAKIMITNTKERYELKNPDGKVYATITPSTYQLVNLMSDFYLFRHVAEYSTESQAFNPNQVFDIEQNFKEMSPNNGYCIDPHFHEKTLLPEVVGKTPVYQRNNYLETTEWASFAYSQVAQSIYVLSNTCYASSQVANYVTGLHVQADIRPAQVYLSTGKTITNQTQMGMLKEVYQYNCNFYDALSAMVSKNPELKDILSWPGAATNATETQKEEFERAIYETYGITHHTRVGASLRSFYYYWIRHDLSSEEPMTPMRYGIVRNNIYDLRIVDIVGPGPGNVNPKRAEMVDKNLMTVRARVGCWTNK